MIMCFWFQIVATSAVEKLGDFFMTLMSSRAIWLELVLVLGAAIELLE